MKLFSTLLLGSLFAGAQLASASVSDSVEHHQAVSADAAITIINTNGQITVETWDKPEVQVIASRTAKNADDLAKLAVKFEGSEKQVSVRTDSPAKLQHASIDYVVKVPASVTIKKAHSTNGDVVLSGVAGAVNAGTVNGDVSLRDISGSVKAESVNGNIAVVGTSGALQVQTVNGKVDLRFAQLADGSKVEARTVNGSVDIALPAGSSAKLSANTKNGSVKNNFGLPKAKRSFGGTSFEGVIGDGSAAIEVETVNGSVEFTKS